MNYAQRLDSDSKAIHAPSIDFALEMNEASEHSCAPSLPLVSVVIPCLGQLEYVRLCVQSLLRHCRSPYELIFVDLESLDGTAEYLAGVSTAASARVEVVSCQEGQGFPAACDLAIGRAGGSFIVILSSDTIVTAGWLNHLTALVAHDPMIGVAGPMANLASTRQMASPISYRIRTGPMKSPVASDAVEPLDRFAAQWRDEHKGQWFEAETLDPFCLMFRREALEAISPLVSLSGPPSQAAPLSLLDEISLSRQLRQAGFRLACCHDLFIHYFASRTVIRPLVPMP